MSTASDASEIRRVLQVYDQSGSGVPARQAVGMLEGITGKIAKAPAAYDLLTDPGVCLGGRGSTSTGAQLVAGVLAADCSERVEA